MKEVIHIKNMLEQPCPKCGKKKFFIEMWWDREFLIRCGNCKIAIWLIDLKSLISISAKQFEAKAFLDRFPEAK